ncbi:MAG: transcription antitermination factor NusB [Fusobacteriaceae bacterium]|jgi:N utilization substance protein B|nr:transcription antitermination factor NusB [Fusobacteriaceae bacterium]
MSRKKIREEIFKLVFEGEIRNENLLNILNDFLKRNTEISDENDLNFIKKYLIGINDRSLLIHKQIDDNMTGWVFERIGFVERAIFKCSVYELIEKEIPVEIVVNEAVELAKKYGDEKTSDFINGVLANIIN